MESPNDLLTRQPSDELEVALGVSEADVLHDSPELSPVLRIFAVLHPPSDEVAENAAEIFVACIGKKAARIGEHAHERAEVAHLRERGELPLHPVLLIVEPPTGAELHLAEHSAV